MPVLLLTLLALAIVITIAGYVLTLRLQVPNQHAAYTVPRTGRRVVVDAMPLRARRMSLEVERPAGFSLSLPAFWQWIGGRRQGEPVPWAVIIVGLISIFVLGLYSFSVLLPHPALFGSLLFDGSPPQQNQNPNPVYHASQNLVRIGQLDPGQYNSTQEYNLWAYSACSTASMTEVMNAYGHHYRITDVLKVESGLHEITPALGLLEDVGIQRTVAKFGFKTTWGYSLSLDQIITTANQGRPVIVSFPPYKYPGGHLLVVLGGNSTTVLTADSSRLDHHSFTRQGFLQLWGGFAAIVTPN